MIRDLFLAGQAQLLKEAEEEEKTKKGRLRGGNTSMITPDGTVIGQCANLTWLRYRGVDVEPVTASRDLMFDAGRRNEDHWYEVLSKAYPYKILREEEVATSWKTKTGIAVTGRPDVVLLDEAEKPVMGIELKQASSLWTVRDVLFQKKPKLAHLMQAAHYSWRLGCPFELWYTSRADFAITGDWVKGLFPKPGQPGSEHCQYAFYKEGEINPKTRKPMKHRIDEAEYMALQESAETRVHEDILKVLPFVQGYELDLHDGKLYYKDAMSDTAEWYETIVSVDDIKRYYDTVSTMDTVLPEPKGLNADGSKLGYKPSQYCALGDMCCKNCAGKPLEEWEEEVKTKLSSGESR